MKASELRINNLVYLTNDNFKTKKRYQMCGVDIYKVSESDFYDFCPIPLDDRILIKLGFVLDEEYFDTFVHNENRHIILFKNEDGNYYIDLRFPNGKMISVYFQFVHDLQNFYFSVIGQELNFEKF